MTEKEWMISSAGQTEAVPEIDLEIDLQEVLNRSLIVHNDEVNTFDWVIDSLIKICGHQPTQAEQLTLQVHFKGKANVKNGEYRDLKPMKDKFIERGINATID